MRIELHYLEDVDERWETAHRIRVLVLDGKSPALKELNDLKSRHREDYDRLLQTIRLVAERHRVFNENRVKKGRKYPEIYEMRGGHARLFFFYTSDTQEIVVCASGYWKTKPSAEEQNLAFARANRLRSAYVEGLRGLERLI